MFTNSCRLIGGGVEVSYLSIKLPAEHNFEHNTLQSDGKHSIHSFTHTLVSRVRPVFEHNPTDPISRVIDQHSVTSSMARSSVTLS